MKLIREEIEKVEVITETKNGKKTLYIQGPFLQTEQQNRNGRVYRRNVMEREVKRYTCLLYTSPSPRDGLLSRMPSSA